MHSLKTSLVFRVGADIVLFFLIFLLPWWLSVIFLICALFYFDAYFEIIFFGFLLDSLYGQTAGIMKYLFTILGFVLFCAQVFIKDTIR